MPKSQKKSEAAKKEHEAAVEDIITHFAATYIATSNDRLSASQQLCKDRELIKSCSEDQACLRQHSRLRPCAEDWRRRARTSKATRFFLQYSDHVIVHSFSENVVVQARSSLVEVAFYTSTGNLDIFQGSLPSDDVQQS